MSLFLIKIQAHHVSKILNYVAQFLYNPLRVTKASISERCQVRTDKPLWCRHFQSSMSLIILGKIQILFYLPYLSGTEHHEQIKSKSIYMWFCSVSDLSFFGQISFRIFRLKYQITYCSPAHLFCLPTPKEWPSFFALQ